jgi:molybdenum cofactor cytidylyltransferase
MGGRRPECGLEVTAMIPGVVLAGGASSRMGGRPKALLPTGRGSETFLARIVSAFLRGGVDDVVVVSGYHTEAIVRAAEQLATPIRVLHNAAPERGQLSSLLIALAAIDHPGVRAMLVTLVDLPLVSPATVRAVLEGYRRTGAPIVRPTRDGRHGHPVLFDRSVFDELRRADPKQGAKVVVRAHAVDGLEIEIEDEGAFVDVDTPEDYERVIGVPLQNDTDV